VRQPSIPKKPLASEPCSQRARAGIKEAARQGLKPLCESCITKSFTICPATGHVICSNRKHTGWIPVPFSLNGCGLFVDKNLDQVRTTPA
jgi:hypothetical protein